MRIIHIANEHQSHIKAKKPTKRELESASARRWTEIQSQRNYRKACKELEEEIREIQKVDPNWMPDRVIRK